MKVIDIVKKFFMVMVAMLIVIGGIVICGHDAAADQEQGEKVYTSVQVEPGDTLWSIAEKYAGIDTRAFVSEVAEINGIVNSSSLRAGTYLTVFYYR